MTVIEKIGSRWWILKQSGFPNTHICGEFSFKTKKAAQAYKERHGV